MEGRNGRKEGFRKDGSEGREVRKEGRKEGRKGKDNDPKGEIDTNKRERNG
jgi:hypothetical protein